jgi:hypothetical protein
MAGKFRIAGKHDVSHQLAFRRSWIGEACGRILRQGRSHIDVQPWQAGEPLDVGAIILLGHPPAARALEQCRLEMSLLGIGADHDRHLPESATRKCGQGIHW